MLVYNVIKIFSALVLVGTHEGHCMPLTEVCSGWPVPELGTASAQLSNTY
jgi:hypothetical protein